MYTVLWQEDAAQELYELFFVDDLALRPRISKAAADIDAALARIPFEFGESRESEFERVAFFDCLAIQYFVNEPQARPN